MRYLCTLVFGLMLCGYAAGQQEYRLVGKLPAPSMILTDLAGNKLDTKDLAGKIVVYNLWFVGCPPCMEEIPKLNALVDEYKGSDVVFVGLSTSSAADVNKFLTKQPFSYRIVPGAGREMIQYFGVVDKSGGLSVAFPTHVVVDRDGYIDYRTTGVKGVDGIREILQREAGKK